MRVGRLAAVGVWWWLTMTWTVASSASASLSSASTAAPLALAEASAPANAPIARTGSSAPAQRPAWLLDRFSVTMFDYGQPSRNEARPKELRAFVFGGEYSVPSGNTYRANGTLNVNVPDRIESGAAYSVDARASGELGIVGTVQTDGELAYLEVQGLCWGDSPEDKRRDEKRILPGSGSLSLSVAIAPLAATAPVIVDPTTPPSHNCEFLATLHVGFSVEWRVSVQAQYKPAVPIESGLALDANPTRLPPSGMAPSESVLSASVKDAAGRPVAGERIAFTLEPPDMGRLQSAGGTTDAAGVLRVRYTAPNLAELRGRNRVTVRAAAPGRRLERTLSLEVESYRLSASLTPAELPIQDPPGSAKLQLVAERFDGRPAAGDVIELALDPADMGRLLGDTLLEDRVLTGAQGVAEVFYEAPPVAAMQNRDLVTIFARNLSHGGEASAALRFLGLRVVGAQPPEGVRDVDLRPGGGSVITFDRAIDPASASAATVKVQTLWHGDLAAQPQVAGKTIQIRVTQIPIPDVGLVVTVRLAGGVDGIRGVDGSLLPGDFTLRFMTQPRLDPKVTVSQVVDDPRDPNYGVISVAPKPFMLRVTGGLSADSELTKEEATVTLASPAGGEQTKDHTFYPGDWPPRVPSAIVKHGNSANFVVEATTRAGAFPVTAKVRPFFAPDDKAVAAPPVTVNVNRWRNARISRGLGVLLVPLQNDKLPGYEWTVSRNQLNRWAARLGADAAQYLPLKSMSVRMGYFEDTTCNDPDQCKFESRPWTVFNYWVRHVGRAGYATPWTFVMAVVPPGWFAAKFADHPDVLANPQLYHNMVNNGIWSDIALPHNLTRSAPSASPMIQADSSDSAFVHALGDIADRPHSGAARDDLAGYDLAEDRLIKSDAEGWTGAFLSLMNENVGFGREWTARADYNAFLDRWTEKSCEGVPPCAPSSAVSESMPMARSARVDSSLEAQPASTDATVGADRLIAAGQSVGTDQTVGTESDPVPLIGISGIIKQGASETAKIEPLIWFDGTPTLAAGGEGDYAIVLRDAAGASLGRYAFTPAFGPIDGGRLASFLFAVPRPTGAPSRVSTVALVHDTTEIGVLRKRPNVPTVSIMRPSPGQVLGGGSVEVGWTGQDADGDALTYNLIFSGDGGQSWLPLLLDSSRTAYTLPVDELPNGPDARLRVVASDGFDSGQAEVSFRLNGTQRVLATLPDDGERNVSPRAGIGVVLRDPLDPATVNAGTFTLRDSSGRAVSGVVTYTPLNGMVSFEAAAPLAEATTYEARLTTRAVTTDGRGLSADHVWRFTTRGKSVFLPRLLQSGNTSPNMASPTPTRGPSPVTTRPTPGPGPSATPRVSTPAPPSATPRVSTPAPPSATPRVSTPAPPSATPQVPRTPIPSATTRPTTPRPSSPPPSATPPLASPTPVPITGVVATGALTTGSDAQRTRQAFAAGEPIQLWLGVNNGTGAPVTADFEFLVVGDNGFAPDSLAWRGALQVPTGAYWFSLQRTVPADMPTGPYRLVGNVVYAGRSRAATADFTIAGSLQRYDDFSNPSSGWTSYDDANIHSGYLAGVFQILVKTANFWRFDTPNDSATDFAMEADVSFAGNAAGAAGLVSGFSADGQTWLVYTIVRDGRFGLFRRSAGAWQPILPLASSGVIASATNHLMLTRRGTELRLYANGSQLAVTEESGGTSGRVGLYAEGVEAGLDARFDEFRLYRGR